MTNKPNSLWQIDGQTYIFFSDEQVFCGVPDNCQIMEHVVFGPTHAVDENGKIRLGPKIPQSEMNMRGQKFSKVVVSEFFAPKSSYKNAAKKFTQ